MLYIYKSKVTRSSALTAIRRSSRYRFRYRAIREYAGTAGELLYDSARGLVQLRGIPEFPFEIPAVLLGQVGAVDECEQGGAGVVAENEDLIARALVKPALQKRVNQR